MGLRFANKVGAGSAKKIKANVSRKRIMEIKKIHEVKKKKFREIKQLKTKELVASRVAKSSKFLTARNVAAASVNRITSIIAKKTQGNTKTQYTFEHAELVTVTQGLNETITLMNEEPSPLSMFACTLTALSSTSILPRQIPYLLVIMGACSAEVSQTVLQLKLPVIFKLFENLLEEHSHDSLVVDKLFKCAEEFICCIQDPISAHVLDLLKKLEPNKMNPAIMPKYLQLMRKCIQYCGLTASAKKRELYMEAVPYFTGLCCHCIQESSMGIILHAAKNEFISLLVNTLSPTLVSSSDAKVVINMIISKQLTPLFKPISKPSWSHAADMTETLFSRLAYLKRIHKEASIDEEANQHCDDFVTLFPGTILLLRIFDKIRVVDDATLNPHLEKAMVALGNCITVEQFSNALPFDPRENGYMIDAEDATWTRSYIVNIIKKICSHDSLPFCVQAFIPVFKYCDTASEEAPEVYRIQWGALKLQYFKIITNFCQYALMVDEKSLKTVAQLMTVQLGKPLANTAAAGLRTLAMSFYSLATSEENELGPSKSGEREGMNSDDENEGDDEEAEEGMMPTISNGNSNMKRRKNNREPKISLEDDIDYLSHFDKDWDPHTFHGISKARAIEVCEILKSFSKNIMPRLCNAFESNDSCTILDAIEVYIKVCAPDVMQTILNGIISVGGHLSTDKSISNKRRVVLDIACAVICQLPTDSLMTIFDNIVEPVLQDISADQRLLQKKAYKLLYYIFQHRLKDILPILPRVMTLLRVGQQHVTVSSLKMRIKCLSWALDAYKMYNTDGIKEFIDASVGEVVLFAKERSSGARDMTMGILDKMQRYLENGGYGANCLLHMVIAGLSGRTPLLVASSVVAMAKVVSISIERLSQSEVSSTINIASRLLEHAAIEVRNSAALFIRMMFKHSKKDTKPFIALEESLARICDAIATVTAQAECSSTSKNVMRVLLEKCIKCFGYEKVDGLFPEESKKFLIYCNRMLKREEKKQRREQENIIHTAEQNYFNEMFLEQKGGSGPTFRLGVEDADEEGADLLQNGALKNLVTYTPANRLWTAEDAQEDEKDDMCVVVDNGKVRVLSKKERDVQMELLRRQTLAERLLRRGVALKRDGYNELSGNTKRDRENGRDEDDLAEAQDYENEQLALRYGSNSDHATVQKLMVEKKSLSQTSSSGKGENTAQLRLGGAPKVSAFIQQRIDKREAKRARFEQDIRKGEEFAGQSNSGLGDVKKGNLEPFAYVPLDRRFMNKRHKLHGAKRFATVVHKANKKGGKADMPQRK